MIRHGISLAPFTTFGVGGPAAEFWNRRDPRGLELAVRSAREDGLPVRVLGGGSNILVSDAGVKALVVKLDLPAFTRIDQEGDHPVLVCGAGARLHEIANVAEHAGLTGAEWLAGIPGTLGGAITTNAHFQGHHMKEIVLHVSKMEAEPIVLGAMLTLQAGERADILRAMHECCRYRRDSQPVYTRTAGCIFKNPTASFASEVLDKAGLRGTTVRFAGGLLDEAGLKGFTIGGARVSPVHANFIEAQKGATAADIKAVIDEMHRRVMEETGIDLELEIELWGFEEEKT